MLPIRCSFDGSGRDIRKHVVLQFNKNDEQIYLPLLWGMESSVVSWIKKNSVTKQAVFLTRDTHNSAKLKK